MGTSERLAALLALAEEAGAQTIAEDARDAIERAREGLLFVACVGQFKRGKSSLVNALVGRSVLPTGVAPVTSVATVVRHGEDGARVRMGGAWRAVRLADLGDYVSEAKNHENEKHVEAAEVRCEADLLARGVCLVDTPGLGSIFAGNTEATRAFIPRLDAAVIVLGGDPPISGEELALVAELSERIDAILLVLNKADRLSDPELDEAASFISGAIRDRAPRADGPLYRVSASEAMKGCHTRDWDALLAKIASLVDAGERSTLDRALDRRVRSIALRLAAELEEQRRALILPRDEMAARIEALRACAREAEASLGALHSVIEVEERELVRQIGLDRDAFVRTALPRVTAELERALEGAPPSAEPRPAAMAIAEKITERAIRAWLAEQRPVTERRFAELSERLSSAANAYLERIQREAKITGGMAPALEPQHGLRARSRFFYRSFVRLTSPGIGERIANLFRGPDARRRAASAAAIIYARRTLDANANAVAGDLGDRVIESRRSVEASLRRALSDAASSGVRAMDIAAEEKARGEDSVRRAVARLQSQLARARGLGTP